MCGYCYHGFTAVNIFGPAPPSLVASATYASSLPSQVALIDISYLSNHFQNSDIEVLLRSA